MNVQAPFGFVTGCHRGDKFMVQATLASMRHFCPEVPICLVVDGDFDVSDLVDGYGLLTLKISDLQLPAMRQLISGNYRAKLAAMWEGPFEHYVWMDSDAILWGDIMPFIDLSLDFQIFWKEKIKEQLVSNENSIFDTSGIKHYYFDPEKIVLFDPDFQWRQAAYFCAGVYACKRNAINFSDWCRVENFNMEVPGTFSDFGDMGPLNYIVLSRAQSGELKVAANDLQHVPEHHGFTELELDCYHSNWRFPVEINRPRVLHFCGRKPYLFDRLAYSRPFTIARLEHHRRRRASLLSWAMIIWDDWIVVLHKIKRRIKLVVLRPRNTSH